MAIREIFSKGNLLLKYLKYYHLFFTKTNLIMSIGVKSSTILVLSKDVAFN